MDPNVHPSHTSPSAPPSDSFYPHLSMDSKDYPQDLPPPYTFQGTPVGPPQGVPHGAPQVLPTGVPQGAPQVLPQGVPQGAPQVLPQGVPQGAPQVLPQGPNQQPQSVNSTTTETTKNQNGQTVIATSGHPQPVQVVLQGDFANPVPPGVCHICKKGKIKDSATCCSWVACFFLLPFGIIPGLIAFCYACRKPKCTRCGFTHGKKM